MTTIKRNVIFFNEREIFHTRSAYLLLVQVWRWVCTSFFKIRVCPLRMLVPLIAITIEFTLRSKCAMFTIEDLLSYLKRQKDREVTWLFILILNVNALLSCWSISNSKFVEGGVIYFVIWQSISCLSSFIMHI
jgi:hypothetical protein